MNGENAVYYAHSKQIYGTEREREELDWLRATFPEVTDPNKDIGERGDVAPYLKAISKCKVVIISEYKEHVGRGAYHEVQYALSKGLMVQVLRKKEDGYYITTVTGVAVYDVDDWTVRYGRLVVQPGTERKLIR